MKYSKMGFYSKTLSIHFIHDYATGISAVIVNVICLRQRNTGFSEGLLKWGKTQFNGIIMLKIKISFHSLHYITLEFRIVDPPRLLIFPLFPLLPTVSPFIPTPFLFRTRE